MISARQNNFLLTFVTKQIKDFVNILKILF